jgi:nitrite reductase/ring-hydroxylating ferredoxin subunit
MNDTTEKSADCTSCPLTSRRDFVRDTALAVAGVIASLGLARSASALPVSVIRALDRNAASITYPIPAGDSVQIDKDNEVILARVQSVIYAFNLSCPHQNTALRWNETAKEFQCPKHKSKYTPQGSFISGRATRGMDRFAIHRQGTSVVVNVDALYQEDENGAEWKSALVRVG